MLMALSLVGIFEVTLYCSMTICCSCTCLSMQVWSTFPWIASLIQLTGKRIKGFQQCWHKFVLQIKLCYDREILIHDIAIYIYIYILSYTIIAILSKFNAPEQTLAYVRK